MTNRKQRQAEATANPDSSNDPGFARSASGTSNDNRKDLRQTLEKLIAAGTDEIPVRALLDLLNHDCLEPVGAMWGMKKTDYAKHYGYATYYGPEEDEDFSTTDVALELFVDGEILFFVKPWPDIRVRFTTARGVIA